LPDAKSAKGDQERFWKARAAVAKYLMLDTTLVCVHQRVGGRKEGPKMRPWGVPEAD